MRVYFKTVKNIFLSELLNYETFYGYDLNLDNNNGDRIENVIGSNGSNKSLYQTSTGAYVIDENNLNKDDFTINPTILIKEKVHRGNITSSVYEFKYDSYILNNKRRWKL